ncbi:1-aminocyclopropane-1-carboxylate deaminase/D-cysteine desulfhydrase [Vibrio breoganii]
MILSTPLYKDFNLSDSLGVELYIKRDDLYPISGGGNKGRKIQYILNQESTSIYNAVVTCGGAQSNHVRATAIKCRELGIDCTIVIHAPEPLTIEGNYLLLKHLGVRIIHCEMSDISKVMDIEMERFISNGQVPLYIWGGGHSVEGSLAYLDAVKEVSLQLPNLEIDYLVHASGTGTTQAGLVCGCAIHYPKCEVIGISVARDNPKGTAVIKESVSELCLHMNLPMNYTERVNFQDIYHCGGYEETTPALLSLIKNIAKSSGLLLDSTYTGKAFLGLVENINSGKIPKGSTVVFWHTGGLLNLLSKDK